MTEGLKTTIIAGIFTILGASGGAYITGKSELDLERQKYDTALVIKALEPKSSIDRYEMLSLLSEAHLLYNDTVSKYLKQYIEHVNPKNVPQYDAVAPKQDASTAVFQELSKPLKPAKVSPKLTEPKAGQTNFVITSKEQTDPNAAKLYERQGFDALLQKDVVTAIDRFTLSENAYNGYHMVYDIAQYLKKKQKTLESKDPELWKKTYTTLLKEYSWRMPEQAKSGLNQQLK